MLKENSYTRSSPKNPSPSDPIPQQSPSFSPSLDQRFEPTPQKSEQIFRKNKLPDTPDNAELKNSKAYINAMKALQLKIKKLEARLEDNKNDTEGKLTENINNTNKYKQQLEEERKIFNNLETNLKTKLAFLEREGVELKKLLQNANEENSEMKNQIFQENLKRDQEFKQFLKEKNEYKEKIQIQNNKIAYLENLSETLQEDIQNTRKEKLGIDNNYSSLQEKYKNLEEIAKEQKNVFEIEKTRILTNFDALKVKTEKESEFLNNEKIKILEEFHRFKQENEELKEKLEETSEILSKKDREIEELLKDKYQRSTEEYTRNDNNNRSNGKSRFKYYPPKIDEKPKELFSWNTPNSKSIENYKRNENDNRNEDLLKNVDFLRKNEILQRNNEVAAQRKNENYDKNNDFMKNDDFPKKSENYSRSTDFQVNEELKKNSNNMNKNELFNKKNDKINDLNQNEEFAINNQKQEDLTEEGFYTRLAKKNENNNDLTAEGFYKRQAKTNEFLKKNETEPIKNENETHSHEFYKEMPKSIESLRRNDQDLLKNNELYKRIENFEIGQVKKNEKTPEITKKTEPNEENVEKKLNFKNLIEKTPKLKEKDDDLKENLRIFLKNESFSGAKAKKTVEKIEKNEKLNEDSDYDKNITDIIELERDLLEMNRVYHDLTEQILVFYSFFI